MMTHEGKHTVCLHARHYIVKCLILPSECFFNHTYVINYYKFIFKHIEVDWERPTATNIFLLPHTPLTKKQQQTQHLGLVPCQVLCL